MNWDLIRVAEVMLAPVFVLGGLLTLRNPQSCSDQLARLRLPVPLLLVRLRRSHGAGSALAFNILPALASASLASFWCRRQSVTRSGSPRVPLGRSSWHISSRTSQCSAASWR